MIRNKTLYGLSCGIIATLMWSSFYVVGRFLFGSYSIDPVLLTCLRFTSASVVILIFAWCRGELKDIGTALTADPIRFSLLSLIGIVGEGVLVIYSLKYTTAARSCLFANASPIFTAVFAYFSCRELLTGRQLGGMILGFAGMAMVAASQNKGDIFMQTSGHGGDILALASGICWALYTVLGRRSSIKYGGWISGSVSIIAGSVMLLVLLAIMRIPIALDCSLSFWLYLLYMGIFPTGVAYILWIMALEHVEAGSLGSLGYLSALLTMIFSGLLLKEKMDLISIIGAVLVFTGAYYMCFFAIKRQTG
ncbi:MAG: DMT family transporter [bacterium]|nr:DMT family transporter [bacterium]